MANAPVYMVDFAVFNPSPEMRADWNYHREHSQTVWRKYGVSEKMISFCDKVFNGSGIAQDVAALPPWLLPNLSDKPYTDLDHSAREARLVQGSTVAELLRKTGLEATDIDILVTNCSIYCPVPSMASLLINMFGMREDVQAYHLGGMGCSMGVVGLNLVRDLLKAHPNKTALFISNEVVTAGFYIGERREALITNTLFRMGGSACILTNRPSFRLRSKYSLFHVNRVHTGRFPRAFGCLNLEPDEYGVNGLLITKDLPSEAALALNKAIGQVAPLIMSWSQYAEAAMYYAQDFANMAMGRKRLPAYQPDFTKCADKFLMHAGGYAILQAVKNGLKLPADKMMPSFVSLRDYGNTSSSSTWYTWGYIEACEGIKAGETVMQIGVGGGMKAGVAIWRALRTFKDNHPAWAHLNGRVQTEADLPRPITVAYKSVYDSKAALEAQQKLQAEAAAAAAAGPDGAAKKEKLKIEFDASKVNRNLKIRSWKDIPVDDINAWWRAPPGAALDDEPPSLATRGWLGDFKPEVPAKTAPAAFAAPAAEAVKPSAAADAGKLKLVVMAP